MLAWSTRVQSALIAARENQWGTLSEPFVPTLGDTEKTLSLIIVYIIIMSFLRDAWTGNQEIGLEK
jgi:hypothetical protein